MRKKTGDTWYGISEKNQLRLPTAALSASGIRVEVDYFLSACRYKLPWVFILLFQCNTGAGVCQSSKPLSAGHRAASARHRV